MHITIIYFVHSIIIVFLIKTSWENIWRLLKLIIPPVWEVDCKNVLPNVTYSPSHRQAGAPMINVQSTLRTATGLCKYVPLPLLFGSNGNSYTVSTQAYIYIYIYIYIFTHTHILHNIDTLFGWRKLKFGTAVNALFQGNFHACHFGHTCHYFANPGLQGLRNITKNKPRYSSLGWDSKGPFPE
jgi:hypothetical protein